ncbi:MAG: hypothetical protein E6K19_03680 [Methanobacteriota archaeon]|nr:MAG: hypothetical protein E6K19_03680 [Euryarchaeota archaeon]
MIEERSTLASLTTAEGQREMGLGHWNRAVRQWERGLEALKKVGDPADYVRSVINVAGFCLDHGDVEQAATLLREANGMAQKLAGNALIDVIEALKQRVDALGVRSSTARPET